MMVGVYIMAEKDKSKLIAGLSVVVYSVILLLQTVWILFSSPHFYPQITYYLSTNIFLNYPFFFRMLGVIIPPLAGSIIFMSAGLTITRNSLKIVSGAKT